MGWWAAPGGKRLVYVPSSLEGLPYQRDAWRAFVDGLSPRLIGGTTIERHPCQ